MSTHTNTRKKNLYICMIYKIAIDYIKLSGYVCIIIIIILLHRDHKNVKSKRKKIRLLSYNHFHKIHFFTRSKKKPPYRQIKYKYKRPTNIRKNIDKTLQGKRLAHHLFFFSVNLLFFEIYTSLNLPLLIIVVVKYLHILSLFYIYIIQETSAIKKM